MGWVVILIFKNTRNFCRYCKSGRSCSQLYLRSSNWTFEKNTIITDFMVWCWHNDKPLKLVLEAFRGLKLALCDAMSNDNAGSTSSSSTLQAD